MSAILKKIFDNFSSQKKIFNKTIFCVNISVEKRTFFDNYFKEYNIIYVPLKFDIFKYKKIVTQSSSCEILVWDYTECLNLQKFAQQFNISITRVSDGLLCDMKFGISNNKPFSLCFDSRGAYYNSQDVSEFEEKANKYEITEEQTAKIEKYYQTIVNFENFFEKKKSNFSYPPKTKERILVIGQNDNDVLLKYSSSKITNNVDLLKFVREKNPNSEIIFKIDKNSKKLENENSIIPSLCDLFVNDNVSNEDLFTSIDKVYTISSNLGFDALVKNIPVYTLGLPFYAGWGLTFDKEKTTRRTKKLTLNELISLVCFDYFLYYDKNGVKCSVDEFFGLIMNYLPNKGKDDKSIKMLKNSDSKNKVKKKIEKKKIDNQSNSKLINVDKMTNKEEKPEVLIHSLFYSYLQDEFIEKIDNAKNVFLYIPWIKNHTDVLIKKIKLESEYSILPLNIFKDLDSKRVVILKFARENPTLYRNYIKSIFVSLCGKIKGVIFTFDWNPITRIIVDVCNELEINTILVPHESVFLNKDKYYQDITSLAKTPICNHILTWGSLQKDIFVERGVDPNRVHVVGSPKLDEAVTYSQKLSHDRFCALYNVSPNKPIILFATQYLDSQVDTKLAQKKQNLAILDLLEYCEMNDAQMIIRQPPGNKNICHNSTMREIMNSRNVVIDSSPYYLTSPNESISHVDLVVSINSTMLLEAFLMNKKTCSIRYMEGITSIWNEVVAPFAANKEELLEIVEKSLNSEFEITQDMIEEKYRLANIFGIGEFDGKSNIRIQNFLTEVCEGKISSTRKSDEERFFDGERMDVVRIPSPPKTINSIQRYIQKLLNTNTLLYDNGVDLEEKYFASVQVFFEWGTQANKYKDYQRYFQKKMGKDKIYLEDGFIRSIGIGLSGQPTLSIVFSKNSSYYDATKSTSFEQFLNSDFELNDTKKTEVFNSINSIVKNKISKYNHVPSRAYHIGRPGFKKLLLIDQRFGDSSVTLGNGSPEIFDNMLTDAINNYADYDIIIKQHPDSISGLKSSFFNNEKLSFVSKVDNVFVIDFEMNPYDLLNQVDEVFVCSSGMGFEALLAGKKVTCYGTPWYANWGVTIDKQTCVRRNKKRSLEDLFYVAYMKFARYYLPTEDRLCTVEEIVDYITTHRDAK